MANARQKPAGATASPTNICLIGVIFDLGLIQNTSKTFSIIFHESTYNKFILL